MGTDMQLHRQAAEWFINLREEPEDMALRAAFESWLAADPGHGAAYRSVECTFGELGDGQSDLLAASQAVAIPRPRSGHRRVFAQRPRTAPRAAIGAAIAACLLIAITPSLRTGLMADHQTGAGEIRKLKLADGSIVRLGPDSAIAVDLASNGRTVRLLAGQAWFEVTRDASRPFRVRADDITTTVLGTGFDVRRLGAETMVSVAHGKVRVNNAATGASHDLLAGQWVRIDADRQISSGTANPELLGTWVDGRIVAKGLTVEEVIDEIRPWYRGKIILTSSELGQRKVSGIYDASKPWEALSALISPDGGVVRRITPWLLIVSK